MLVQANRRVRGGGGVAEPKFPSRKPALKRPISHLTGVDGMLCFCVCCGPNRLRLPKRPALPPSAHSGVFDRTPTSMSQHVPEKLEERPPSVGPAGAMSSRPGSWEEWQAGQGPRSLTSQAASQGDWGCKLEAVHDSSIKHDENLNLNPDRPSFEHENSNTLSVLSTDVAVNQLYTLFLLA